MSADARFFHSVFWFMFPTPEHDRNLTATPGKDGEVHVVIVEPKLKGTVVCQAGGSDRNIGEGVGTGSGHSFFRLHHQKSRVSHRFHKR